MKKKITAVLVLFALLISGCSVLAKFEQAKDKYLETRVSELLAEDAEQEVLVEEDIAAEPEEEVAEDTEEKAAEEAEEELDGEVADDDDGTEQADEEVTEEPDLEDTEEETDADETPEETEEPEPTVESDDPAVYLGESDWVDEMETGKYWTTGTGELTAADYVDGTLEIVALSEINGWRIASQPVLKNAYIEAEVSMGACASTDGYGIIFRVPETSGLNRGYLFGITCEGKYAMRKWDGLSGEFGTMIWLQYYKESGWINVGKDQTNRIGVMAVDDRLVMYVNGEMIGEVAEDDYESGFFGMYINRDKTENLTINVDRVSYWIIEEAD
jgi:outer membrane murein-binding lipoprotein Lpp